MVEEESLVRGIFCSCWRLEDGFMDERESGDKRGTCSFQGDKI